MKFMSMSLSAPKAKVHALEEIDYLRSSIEYKILEKKRKEQYEK